MINKNSRFKKSLVKYFFILFLFWFIIINNAFAEDTGGLLQDAGIDWSFENSANSTTVWLITGTAKYSNSQKKFGNSSFNWEGLTTNYIGRMLETIDSVPVTSEKIYKAGIWWLCSSAANYGGQRMRIIITYYNNVGTVISSETSAEFSLSAQSIWEKKEFANLKPPSSAVSAKFKIQAMYLSETGSGSNFFDGAYIISTPPPPPAPTLISPIDNYETNVVTITISGTVPSAAIGDSIYLYKNNQYISEQKLLSSSFNFSDIALNQNNSFYAVVVDAAMATLISETSNYVNVLCDTVGPKPVSFNFTDVTETKPVLTFPAFSDSVTISSYIFLIDDAMDFSSPDTYFVSTNSVSIDTPLTVLTRYYVKIKGIDRLGNTGQFSEIVSFIIMPFIVGPTITEPKNLTETNAMTLTVSGTFAQTAGFDSIILFVDNKISDTVNLVNNAFSFNIANLSNDTHSIYVCAYNKIENYYSGKSTELKFLYDTAGPVPSIISFPNSYSETITLAFNSFSDSTSIDTYFVLIAGAEDFSDSKTYKTSSLSLNIYLKPNNYYAKIYAVDKLGNIGLQSNTSSFTIIKLVISEICAKNGNEYVELYNPSAFDISLKGKYISYFSSTRNWNAPYLNYAFLDTAVIKSHGFYLIGFSYTENSDWKPPSSDILNGSDGSVGIFDTNPTQSSVEYSITHKIDAVGWGGVQNVFEGVKLSSINDSPVERKAKSNSTAASMTTGSDSVIGNSFDDDNNFNDFVFIQRPNPQTSKYIEPDITPPDDIVIFSLVASSESVILKWIKSNASDFAYYKIYYSERSFTIVKPELLYSSKTDINDTQIIIMELLNNQRYWFAVTAVDVNGLEDTMPSVILSDTPLASLKDDTPPEVITDLTVLKVTPFSVILEWTTPTDIFQLQPSRYELRYSTAAITDTTEFSNATLAAGISEKVPLTAGQIDSFTINNLNSNTTYYFAIASWDAYNNMSPIVFLPTVSATIPSGRVQHLVISEVAVGYGSADTEYIELYNPSAVDINLSNYKLKVDGNQKSLTFVNNTIPAFGFFLIVCGNIPGRDAYWSGAALSGSGGSAVQIYDSSDTVIDGVAWSNTGTGHDAFKEGSVYTVNFATGASLERKVKSTSTESSMKDGEDSNIGNSFDSDNNSLDFVYHTNYQNPQNSTSNKEYPPDLTPPAAPTLISPINNYETNADIITISGTVLSDAIGDSIYLYRNNTLYGQKAITSSDFIFENISLVPNQYNSFYVITGDAVISGLVSEKSNTINILCDVSGPSPTSISFNETFVVKPVLKFPSFSDSVSIVSYIVLIDDAQDFSSPDTYITRTTSVTIDTALNPLTIYYVKIVGIDKFGNIGQFSNTASFLVTPYIVAPIITSPVNLVETNALSISISGTFTQVENVDSIVLFLDENIYDTANIINNAFSFNITRLSNNYHTIYAKAYTHSDKYYGDKSASITFLYDTSGPIPSTISVGPFYSETISLKFSDFTDSTIVDTYIIFLSKNIDFIDSTVYYTKYPILNINLNFDTYYIKCYAIDRLGNIGSMSAISSFLISSSTGQTNVLISEISAKNGYEYVELYNPTAADISLKNFYLCYYSSARDWNQPYSKFCFPDAVIKSWGYYLVSFSYTGISDWAAAKSDVLNGAEGSVGLFNIDPSKSTVQEIQNYKLDAVGWGNAQYVYEETTVAAINDVPVERKAKATSDSISMTVGSDSLIGNGYDSNNNRNDFIIRVNPDPQTSSFTEPDFIAPDKIGIDTVIPSCASVVLKWDMSNALDFRNYKIYYSTDPIVYVKNSVLYKIIDDKTMLETLISGLQNDVKYYFAVTASDYSGNEDFFPATIVNATPLASLLDETPPLQIDDLKLVDSTAISLTLQWTTPFDKEQGKPAKYQLRYSTLPINNMIDFYNANLDTNISSKVPRAAGIADTYIITNLSSAVKYYLALVSIDNYNNTSALSVVSGYTKTGISDSIVISEIGKKYNNITDNNFIELYNPTNNVVSLKGYSVQKGTGKPGTITKVVFTAADKINPYSYYLIANSVSSETVLAICDKTIESLSFGSSGFVALAPFSVDISANNISYIIDIFGWGDGYAEGSPFSSAPADNKSIERKARISSDKISLSVGSDSIFGNAFDSNNNSTDFVIQEASLPQSSKSFAEVPFGVSNPDTVPPPQVTTLVGYDYFNNGSVLLKWKPVLDYDNYGRGNGNLQYIVKYSTSNITDTLFDNAVSSINNLPGSTDTTYITYIITNLEPGKTYYFAVKSLDKFRNLSAMSNVVSHTAYSMPVKISENINNEQSDIVPGTEIILTFSTDMDIESVMNHISISPAINYTSQWTGKKILELSADWMPSTNYQIKIAADNTYNKTHSSSIDGNNNNFAEGSPFDDYILNFSTPALILNVPLSHTGYYDTTISNLLLKGGEATIALNNCAGINLNVIGVDNNDKWVISYSAVETGYFITLSTNFLKNLSDESRNYYIDNVTNLERSIKITVKDRAGIELTNADMSLKFYYEALEYKSTDYIGIFKDKADVMKKLNFVEIINKNYFGSDYCENTDYEIDNVERYISINVKKTGIYGVGCRQALVNSLDNQSFSINVNNINDSYSIGYLEISGKYNSDTLSYIKFVNKYNISNENANLYLYESADSTFNPGADIFICKMIKSDTDSFYFSGNKKFNISYKILVIADFKNLHTGDAMSLYIPKTGLKLSYSDTENFIDDIDLDKTISFYEMAHEDDTVIVLINEICISPQQVWSSVNYIYNEENKFAANKVSDNDEYIELVNKSDKAIDISQWSLIVSDDDKERFNNIFQELNNETTFLVFSKAGSITKFLPDEYLVVGNPPSNLINDIKIELKNNNNEVVDVVATGAFNDGDKTDNAPSGSSTSMADEAIGRYPDGVNTNNNKNDFYRLSATPCHKNITVPTIPTITFPFNSNEVDTYYISTGSIFLLGTGISGSYTAIEINDSSTCTVPVNKLGKFELTLDSRNGLIPNYNNKLNFYSYYIDGGNIIKSGNIVKRIIIDTGVPEISIIKPVEHYFDVDGNKTIELIGSVQWTIPLSDLKIILNNGKSDTLNLDANNYFYYTVNLDTNYSNIIKIRAKNFLGKTSEEVFKFFCIKKVAEISADAQVTIDTALYESNKSVSYLFNSTSNNNYSVEIPLKNNNDYSNLYNLNLKFKENNKYYLTVIKPDTTIYDTGTEQMMNYKDNSFTLIQFDLTDVKGNYVGDSEEIFDTLVLKFNLKTKTDKLTKLSDIGVFTFNENNKKWEYIGDTYITRTGDTIIVALKHLSVDMTSNINNFALAASNLQNVEIYPNPFIPNDNNDYNGKEYTGADDGSGIYINNLMTGSKIEIYDIAGAKVFEAVSSSASGYYQWNVRNENGNKVASGIYILIVTNGGQKVIKKFGIIR